MINEYSYNDYNIEYILFILNNVVEKLKATPACQEKLDLFHLHITYNPLQLKIILHTINYLFL